MWVNLFESEGNQFAKLSTSQETRVVSIVLIKQFAGDLDNVTSAHHIR